MKRSATPSTRSLFDGRVVAVSPAVVSDGRGALAELVRRSYSPAPLEHIYSVAVAPGRSRGGHYHKRKHEWFAVVSGECHLALWDAEKPKRKVVLTVGPRSECMVVSIEPGISHTFTNDNGWQTAIVIAIASEEYDPAEEDTYRLDTLKPREGDYHDG